MEAMQLIVYDVYYCDYKNKTMEMMGALTERRKDPRRQKDLMLSALRWMRTQFGGFVKDSNAIIIMRKELAEDSCLGRVRPAGQTDSRRSPFLQFSSL
jgi:hypothetical protein